MMRRSVISAAGALVAGLVGGRSADAAAPAAAAGAALKLTTEDRLEIQDLYARYCHGLDKADPDMFSSCWTEDGEFTGGRGPGRAADDRTPRKGRDALTNMARNGGTRHFNSNLVLTPTVDGAKASVYLLLYTARTVPPTFVETAIYDDTLVKTPAGWKFKKRIVWRDDDDITPFKPKPLPANR